MTQCRDEAEITAAVASAGPRSHLPLAKQLKRLLHRDWYPSEISVDVQMPVSGNPAMYCGVAVGGKLVAGFAGLTRRTGSVNGPSSIVSIGEHADMRMASEALIAALGATGFVGFDFMIESKTGHALLIECNPRPIPVCHLGSRIGVDLCAALSAGLRGEAQSPVAKNHSEEIRLFPQEWQRDPLGVANGDTYLDVPWDDPSLLRAMLNTQHPEKRIV